METKQEDGRRMVSMQICQRRLAKVWFITSGLIYLFMFIQTVTGNFGDNAEKAWEWIMPNTLPVLSLIISFFVVERNDDSIGQRPANTFFFQLSYYLSLFILFLIIATILLEPVANQFAGITVLELYRRSNFLLSPLQGLLTASIGVFFLKKN